MGGGDGEGDGGGGDGGGLGGGGSDHRTNDPGPDFCASSAGVYGDSSIVELASAYISPPFFKTFDVVNAQSKS